MCGIFGYANFNAPRSVEHVMSILFGGLQHLEYRGYDSAGICVDVPAKAGPGVVPEVIKSSGKIVDLQRLAFEQLTASQIEKQSILVNSVGIGHTRWATHGPPTATNSHPHVSDDKRDFVVVHNGIITNYAVLKEFLPRCITRYLEQLKSHATSEAQQLVSVPFAPECTNSMGTEDVAVYP